MKIKAIAILTAIILIVSYVPVYADTVIPDPPSDGYQYWVVCEDHNGNIMLYKSNSPIKVRINGVQLTLQAFKEYIYENNNWQIKDGGNSAHVTFTTMHASNHDIAYEDGSGFFFFRPKVRRLYQVTKITDFGTILRNFSVGLIPIIGCLILVISLRKGWEFLRTQLKH